jgi:uncharacterized tellurite resistance protein B-like protein
MTEKERLYNTLGELLYVVAMADGVIQKAEKEVMSDLFEGHPWANDVLWSFDYEQKRNADVEEIYKKVISFCHGHGPAPEYAEFIDAMTLVAQAANDIEQSEEGKIKGFSADLIKRFQRDLDAED